MEQLVGLVAESVGLPSTKRYGNKFLLLKPPPLHLLPDVQEFEVEKIILKVINDRYDGGDEGGNSGNDNYDITIDNKDDNEDNNDSPKDHDNENSNNDDNNNDDNNDENGSTAPDRGHVLYSFVRKRSQGGFHAYGLTTVKMTESGQKVELKQVITERVYSMLVNSSADKSRHVVRQKRYYFLWGEQSMHIYQYVTPKDGLWVLLCQSEGNPVLPPFITANGVTRVEENDLTTSSYLLSKKK